MPRSRLWLSALLLLSVTAALAASAQTTPAYRYFRLGNAVNITTTPRPGYALMGGGADLDEAFNWLCSHAGGGDLLVLRATGDDAYNPYIQKLCHLNSVATIVISNRAAALDPFVAQAIRDASALFIAGGDQANYVNFWQGTPVQAALNDAIARGVPIGGTSAGLAVLGQYAYTAQSDKPDGPDLDTKTALANPFGPRITLDRNFLKIPILQGVLIDSHFARRNRMGRLLVFLARLTQPDGKSTPGRDSRIRGIGVEQGVAVLADPDGHATVIGHGSAYFLLTKGFVDDLQPGKPLAFRDVTVQKVGPGHAFNLKTWTGDATQYKLSVEAGILHSTQAGGAFY
ncbi:MAG TPA: cyanophycinase [Terracidiphilus sp.]|jgi:cyanophycinase